MKNTIINKLLKKHEKPVEKLVPPVPITAENIQKILPAVGLAARAAAPMIGRAVGAGAKAAKPQLAQAGKTALDTGAKTFGTEMGTSAAKKVKGTMSKQSFDTLFTKQNPALASQMAQRGLIFDRISHRWVKKPENRAQPQTVPTDKLSRQKESERISDEIIQDRNRKIYHHSELTSDDLRDDKFRSELQRSRGQNDPQRYFDAYKQIYGSEQRYSWVQLHSKLSSKEKRERNSEKEQKGFATENWRWSKDPTKKRLDKVEIGFLNALTQENDHAGAMEHIAQFLGDKHLANRASKNRAMRDERRTSTDNRRWSKFNRRVLTEISEAMNKRIQNVSEVNQAM